MQNLNYFKPQTLADALKLMHQHAGHIKPYAGGTDILVQLREGAKRHSTLDYLLDLGGLAQFNAIELKDDYMHIGPMASHTQVAQSPLVQKHAAFLAAACLTVGSPQIRNMATLGGNICNGSPAADSLSPLVALNAQLVIENTAGKRQVLVKDFYEGASKVKLMDDEIVTSINFKLIPGYKNAFIKLGRRKALAISRMNAAAALCLENGAIKDARVVPGCVFSVPDRLLDVEEFINGKSPNLDLFVQCGKMASAEMIKRTGVRWSTEYKEPVVQAMVQRALCAAAGILEE